VVARKKEMMKLPASIQTRNGKKRESNSGVLGGGGFGQRCIAQDVEFVKARGGTGFDGEGNEGLFSMEKKREGGQVACARFRKV